MTLTKKKMVREIGRRTRLTNREVQEVIETLVDVWTEALISSEKIEIENFLVMETQLIDLGENRGFLTSCSNPRMIRKVSLRMSKNLRRKLKI